MIDAFKPRLFVLSWGLYPRRITIYLKERQIYDEFEIVPVSVSPQGLVPAPSQPSGTVPILEVESGTYIRQSSAILEYLEDTFHSGLSMRGDTPLLAARCRELMDLINEATSALSLYVHQASELFASLETQSTVTATTMLQRLHQLLGQIENIADPDGPFLVHGCAMRPTMADCVLLSTWQFADHIYGVDIFDGHGRLKRFLDAMLKRDSAAMDFAPGFILEKSRIISVK